MHERYSKNGVAFLAGENRGSYIIKRFQKNGKAEIIGSAFEIFEECVYDIDGWVNFASRLGYRQTWLQSHSLGTSKVAYYMFRNKPKNISGLVFISPSEMIGLVHDPEGLKDHEKLYPEAMKLVAEGKARKLLSHKLI